MVHARRSHGSRPLTRRSGNFLCFLGFDSSTIRMDSPLGIRVPVRQRAAADPWPRTYIEDVPEERTRRSLHSISEAVKPPGNSENKLGTVEDTKSVRAMDALVGRSLLRWRVGGGAMIGRAAPVSMGAEVGSSCRLPSRRQLPIRLFTLYSILYLAIETSFSSD